MPGAGYHPAKTIMTKLDGRRHNRPSPKAMANAGRKPSGIDLKRVTVTLDEKHVAQLSHENLSEYIRSLIKREFGEDEDYIQARKYFLAKLNALESTSFADWPQWSAKDLEMLEALL